MCGLFPQCGLAAAASNFYAARVISAGTLIAVYLSTSDEMLPILISSAAPVPLIAKILLIKVAAGLFFGLALDFFACRSSLLRPRNVDVETLCRNDDCKCEEGGGIWRSALRHSLKITLFVLVVSFLFNLAMAMLGAAPFVRFLSHPLAGVLVGAGVGLLVLYRVNPRLKENLLLTAILYSAGVLIGSLIDFLG